MTYVDAEYFWREFIWWWLDGFPVWERVLGKEKSAVRKEREHDNGYEVDIDLPGFKKDEISLELENGYLTVSAVKGLDKDEQDSKGKYIRRERYAGAMQRSFYVGDTLTQEDIKAKYDNGILSISVPKKDARAVETKKTIAIEGWWHAQNID